MSAPSGNHISTNPDAEFGPSDLTGWIGTANLGLSTSGNNHTPGGANSFRLQANATGALGSHAFYQELTERVQPDKKYDVSVWMLRGNGLNRSWRVRTWWYDYDEVFLSSAYSNPILISNAWTNIKYTVTAPPNAYWARWGVYDYDAALATADVFYVDDWFVKVPDTPVVPVQDVQYDPGLLKVYRYVASGATDLRYTVSASSVSINHGYSRGEGGELSIDPSSANLSMSWRMATPTNTLDVMSTLYDRQRVAIFYAGQRIFSGYVNDNGSKITYDAEEPLDQAGILTFRAEYELSGLEADLQNQIVTWSIGRAEESAIDRLQRYFVVDPSGMIGSEWESQLYLFAPADPPGPGQSTKLDEVRAFSKLTGLPVHFRHDRITASPVNPVIEVLEPYWNHRNNGYSAVGDARDWSSEVHFSYPPSGGLIAQDAVVISDDTRFIGVGPASEQSATIPFGLGGTASLPRVYVQGALRPPHAVKVFGTGFLTKNISMSASSTEGMNSSVELTDFPDYDNIGVPPQPL